MSSGEALCFQEKVVVRIMDAFLEDVEKEDDGMALKNDEKLRQVSMALQRPAFQWRPAQ